MGKLQNRPSGRSSAGQRADPEVFPNRIWPKSYPEALPARGRPGPKTALRRSLCVITLGRHMQGSQPQKKTFLAAGADLGPQKLLDAACAYTRPTNPRFAAPNNAWVKKGSQTQPVRTLGRRIQGRAPNKAFLEAGAGLGFKKILRCSLRVHSANKSYVYKPKQNPFGGRGRSGIKKLLDATCAYTRPTIPRFTAPNKTIFGGRGRPGPKTALRLSLCVHSANEAKVHSLKQGLGQQMF